MKTLKVIIDVFNALSTMPEFDKKTITDYFTMEIKELLEGLRLERQERTAFPKSGFITFNDAVRELNQKIDEVING
jgi:hypothetical protein